MNQIGKLLKETMRESGWSNYRLAKKTGLLENNISHVLGVKGNPQWMTVQKILNAIEYEVILKKKDSYFKGKDDE